MIIIRQAVYDDIPRIMQFIDEHWKKGHIMGNDRVMFEFQHVRDGEVFYILAEDDISKKIYGTMGYIPMMEQEWACMSTVMIRSLDNPENRLLGEEMARYFEKNMQCYNVFSVGVEKKYANSIKAIGGAQIERLKHYYRLGYKNEFTIANIEHVERLPYEESDVKLLSLTSAEQFLQKVNLEEVYKDYPRRSPRYIEHRYYNHPYYEYEVFGIYHDGDVKCAFATREEEVNGVKILRIVDLFGREREFSLIGSQIDDLLRTRGYEYIDFYCYGIDEQILRKSGFSERKEKDKNIIPNYFDPFVRENIEIFFYTWYLENIHVYRGFGDQDRPNYAIKNRKGEKT